MDVARAFDVLQRYTTACSDEREELAFGFVVRTPSLPAARALKRRASSRGWLTFIVADADDRPRELYARLGFEAQTTLRSFWRPA